MILKCYFIQTARWEEQKAVARLQRELKLAVLTRENKALKETVQSLTKENEELREQLSVSMQKSDDFLVDVRTQLNSTIASIDKKINSHQHPRLRVKARGLNHMTALPVTLCHEIAIRGRKEIVSIVSTTSCDSSGSCSDDAVYTPVGSALPSQFTATISCQTNGHSCETVSSSELSSVPTEQRTSEDRPAAVMATNHPSSAACINVLGGQVYTQEDTTAHALFLMPAHGSVTTASKERAHVASLISQHPDTYRRANMKSASATTVPKLYATSGSEGECPPVATRKMEAEVCDSQTQGEDPLQQYNPLATKHPA